MTLFSISMPSFSIQDALVAAILLWAVIYIVRRLWRTAAGTGGGCGSTCKGCGSGDPAHGSADPAQPPGAFVPLESLEASKHPAAKHPPA